MEEHNFQKVQQRNTQSPASEKEEHLAVKQAGPGLVQEQMGKRGPGAVGINRKTGSRSKGVTFLFTWHLLDHIWTSATSFEPFGTRKESQIEQFQWRAIRMVRGPGKRDSGTRAETRGHKGLLSATPGTCGEVMEKMKLGFSSWCMVGEQETMDMS